MHDVGMMVTRLFLSPKEIERVGDSTGDVSPTRVKG